ncbi:hypothetical protein Tco_0324749 [Tanacetum coccineum]
MLCWMMTEASWNIFKWGNQEVGFGPNRNTDYTRNVAQVVADAVTSNVIACRAEIRLRRDRVDFRDQDKRFTGRMGNDSMGRSSECQRSHWRLCLIHLFVTTCGMPHPGVVIRLMGDVLLVGLSTHKVEGCPREAEAEYASGYLLGLPLQQDRFMTTRL